MTALEMLWKQAVKTFGDRRCAGYKLCQKNFEELWVMMNRMTAEDLKVSKHMLDFVRTQSTSMFVMNIFENKDITISVFILQHGVTLPLHDHPGMHGFLKVISGIVEINNYTIKANSEHIIKTNEEIRAFRHQPITVNKNSPACVLTPTERNLHEILCVEGPAAFLDVLSPSYDTDRRNRGPRPCTFFKTVSSKVCVERDIVEEVKLSVLENPPNFYSQVIKYPGPPLV